MADLKFEIKQHFGILATSDKGWTKELNLVSWNEREEKYDIREWSENHDKMTKGITLTGAELRSLKEILVGMDSE